jgi:hypothetical protein
MRCFLIVFLFLGAVVDAGSLKKQAIYFDSNYTGSENGTEAEPYNSFSDVSGSIQSGTTVYLKCGSVFRAAFRAAVFKGTEDQPVVFDSYGTGSKPVIRGTIQVTDWSDENGDGIWEARASGDISAFFINGEKQILARYPNRDAANDGWAKITQRPREGDFSRHLVAEGLKDAGCWEQARCVVRAAAWEDSILDVARWDNQKKTLYFDAPLYGNGRHYQIGWGFYLENVLDELDADGEWFYEKSTSTLYYKKPVQVDLQKDVADVSVLDAAFSLDPGDQYVQFKNLHIEGFRRYGIVGTQADHILIDGCTFMNNGYADISFSGSEDEPARDLRVCNSQFFNSKKWCIHLDMVDGYQVENNETSDNYYTAIMISIGANGRVAGNMIRRTGYNGVHLSRPVENNIIEYNFVDDFCSQFTDGGAYYTWDNMPMITGNPADAKTRGWNEIRNNFARTGHTHHLANGNSQHSSFGIYLDDNATLWRVYDNKVISPGNICYMLHNTRKTVAYNNLFYGGNKCSIFVVESDQVGNWWLKEHGTYENMSDNDVTNNVCYINTPPMGGLYAVPVNWVCRYENPDDMLRTLDYNRYYNPFQNVLDVREYYVNGTGKTGGTKVMESLTLEDHREKLKFDLHSMLKPGDPDVTLAEELSGNLMPNPDFSGEINEDACWPRNDGPMTGHPAAWVKLSKVSGMLDDACLKAVPGNSGSSFWISSDRSSEQIGVEAGKMYRLSFTACAAADYVMNVQARQDYDSKQLIGCDTSVKISAARQNYTVYFKASATETDARLVFTVNPNAGFVCIDNLALKEILLTEQDHSFVLVNTNLNEAVSIPLEEGSYVDPDGFPVANPVQVPPWDARIIVRKANKEGKK